MDKLKYTQLLENEELLNVEISKTNGYILEEIKSSNMKIDKNLLFKNLNVFSLKFLKENYELSDQEKEKIDQFLSDNAKSFSNKVLNQEQIEYFLNSEIELPGHIVLELDTIKKNKTKILKQIDISEYGMKRIFAKTLVKLSVDEINSIDKEILIEMIDVVASKKLLINDSEFKDVFKKLVFDNFKNPTINLFKNFSFQKEDRDMLIQLLANTNTNRFSRLSYVELKAIEGVEDLLNKYDYYKMFKIKSIEKDFTNGEVDKNPEFFQNLWKDTEEKRTFDFFDFVLRNESTFEQFRSIVSKDFIIEAFAKESYIYNLHSRIDKEYNKILVDKQIYLLDQVLSLYLTNEKIGENKYIQDLITEDTLFTFIKEVRDSRYQPVNLTYAQEMYESIEKNTRKLYEKIVPTIFHKNEIDKLLDDETTFFNPKVISFSEDILLQNSSINSFYIINKLAKKYEKSYLEYEDKRIFYKTMEPTFKKIFEDLSIAEKNEDLRTQNRFYILEILKTFETESIEDFLSEQWGKNYQKTFKNIKVIEDEFNLFNYSVEDLKKLSYKKLTAIYPIRNNIFNDMLENDIKISDELFLSILRNVDEKDYFDYLKKYIDKNLTEVQKNEKLYEQLMLSSKQKDLIKIENLSVFDKDYKNCLVLIGEIKKYASTREELSNMFPKIEWNYSFENLGVNKTDIVKDIYDFSIEKDISKQEAKVLFVELYQKGSSLDSKLDGLKKKIPFEYFSSKINSLLIDKKFDEVQIIKNNRLNYDNSVFVNYVNNLSYEELSENLKSDTFFSLLKSELNYDNKTDIKFKEFTEDENLSLLHIFKKKYDLDKETGRRNYNYLYFFDKDKNHFIKNFIIENYPKDLFYSYDFLAKDESSYKPSKFIKEHYTNEEIWKAYTILKEKDGFFSETDVNADYKHFFTHAFFHDKESDGKLKDFLNFIKDKDPVLYVLLGNENIFINGAGWGSKENKDKTRSEVVMEYFKNTYDLNIVLDGLDEIVEMIDEKSQNENFNANLANHSIVSIIHNTYYEKYDKYGRTEKYMSNYSEDETIRIMKFLIEKAPLHMLGRHVIGCANHPVDFFAKNIGHFYDRKNIENFIFPNTKLEPAYLDLHADKSESKERLAEYFCVFIDHAMLIKDKDTINYISHLVNQNIFAEKNLSYDAIRNLYGGKSDMLLSVISKDDRVVSRLKNALLKIDLENKLDNKAPAKKTKKI